MSLKIIKTGLTSDNSQIYIKEIKQIISLTTGQKLMLMVPDRFSYIAEKLICEHIGGIGFDGVDVITLHQFIRQLSGSPGVLSSEGKLMLLRRIINKSLDENSIFCGAKDRNGFIENVLEVITDWKRFCVDVEQLSEDVAEIKESLTGQKLTDLITIYNEYEKEFHENGYKDEADLLLDAAEYIKADYNYYNSVWWIDGFVEFTPSELAIIKALLECNADVRVYLPCKNNGDVDVDDVSYVPERTLESLCKICRECGFVFDVVEQSVPKSIRPEIRFFCDTYDQKDRCFDKSSEGIVISSAEDVYSEVEYAASEILNLVCNKDYDFSDISVLCGDITAYNSCIEAVFARYGIPYFSDYKVPLSNHPVSVLLLSVFEIVYNKSFSLNYIVRYLKTGYVIKNNDDIDMLILYAEKRGIRGSMWEDDKYFESFPAGFFNEAMGIEDRKNYNSDKLIKLKRLVVEPLLAYYQKSKGLKTVKEHISVFFDYLKEIELFNKIYSSVEEFESLGEENEASRLTHVWNLLINLFDQMVIAIGDEKINRNTFGEYLKAGIEGSEISIIPTVTNGVSVSDAGHRKGSDVKALFVLGATRETVPAVKHEDGLISEEELASVNSLPITVGKNYRNRSKEFELLTAFSETSDYLYISWCSLNSMSEKEIPSPVFELLLNKFNDLKFKKTEAANLIFSPESVLHRLLVNMSGGGELTEFDKAAIEWFSNNPEWSNAFELLNEAEKYNVLSGCIPKDISVQLYKNLTQYSVSRLEKFFMCPFMYFVTYGLRLDDGEGFGMKSTDTGSLVHHALAEFCERAEAEAATADEKREIWINMTDERKSKIIDEIMGEIIEKSGINISEDNKLQNVFSKIKSTVIKATDIIVLMQQKGKYSIYGNELHFDDFKINGADGEVAFNGTIDRIDVMETEESTGIRIVDYKTGDKKFSFEDALNGIDIQLLIYAMAAEHIAGEGAEVSGFFYNSLKKRIPYCKDKESVVKELDKMYKLSGIVSEKINNNEFEIKTGLDMDCDLIETGESSFLPLKLKSKGGYRATSGVESPEFINEVFRNVKELVATGAARIKNGDVRAYPYVSGSKDSCKFCPYSTICMYDNCRGAEINKGELGKQTLDEIKNYLKEE